MNRTLKIGLIGFFSTIGFSILLRLALGISTIYFAPLALPWGVVVIWGAMMQQKNKNDQSGN